MSNPASHGYTILSGSRRDGTPISFPPGMNPTTDSPEDWMRKREKKGVQEIITVDKKGEKKSWYLYAYGSNAGKVSSYVLYF